MEEGVTTTEAASIASYLTGELKIPIAPGTGWAYNFVTKTIYYREDDLWGFTEVDVVGNLLHEAGHAKYSTNWENLDWQTIVYHHRLKMQTFINSLEDFRVEDKMRDHYPYAIDYLPLYGFKAKYVLEVHMSRIDLNTREMPKYLEYTWAIYCYVAGFPEEDMFFSEPEIKKVYEQTKSFARLARYTNSTQDIMDIAVREVYPRIKDWLDEWEEEDPNPISRPIKQSSYNYPSYDDLFRQIKPLIKPTLEQLRRILTDNIFDRYAGKFTSGRRIDKRRLYKIRTGDFRLFQRQVKALTKDYVFALVVDESGSMSGEPSINAVKGAILFSHVLEKLDISFGIYGFNAKYKEYKKVNEPFRKKHQENFEEMMHDTEGADGGYNNDGDAIFSTAEALKPYTSRKVIVVLSDEQPAPFPGSPHRDLRTEIKAAIRQSIRMISLRIRGTGDSHYPGLLDIRDVAEIPARIAIALKKELK